VRVILLLAASVVALSACDPAGPAIGPDGRPLPKVYRISAAEAPRIQERALDTVNALRQASGAQPLVLSTQLSTAAATHSRDMARQNRPWHFGSDGSSPLDRAARAGYRGRLIGQNISETYETELETIAAWMQQPDTRTVMLDPAARDLGISFYQEDTGKIWWTLVTGG
jgi:uncharacterized protein YkwD